MKREPPPGEGGGWGDGHGQVPSSSPPVYAAPTQTSNPYRDSGDVITRIADALAYAERGWPVFPCHSSINGRCSCGKADCQSPGKHPRVEHGLKGATTDPAIIRSWWAKWPTANIAVATGAESGVVVIDVDLDHGGQESLYNLQEQHGLLPDTPEAITGGGGCHILFQHPGGPVRNSTGKLGPGLDIRGDGGYIIAPPSRHISGNTYTWDAARSPDTMPLAPMPPWLLELVTDKAGGDGHHQVAPIGDIIAEGERNATLTSLAGTMRRRGASEAGIAAALLEENRTRCDPPLDGDEVGAIAASISRYPPSDTAVTLPVSEAGPGSTESEPVDGAALLDEVAAFIRRYVVLTPEQADTLALWAMHTHALDAAISTPYVSVSSPEKRSGKSLTLEVLSLLTARPWLTGRVTAAVLVRKIDRDQPSLLLDESDAAFKSGQEYAEALRGMLNSGHRRGGVASLCVKSGGDFDLRDFATFCPKCIAGIGRHLPDTVADRAIGIVLKRRQPNETIERFRRSLAEADAKSLREGLAAWAASNIETLKEARPNIPDLDDRAADGWEPLLAIADLAEKGDWPRRARVAALALSSGENREDESQGVRLLADVRVVFEERGVDRFSSVELCHALNALEESPWGDLKGKPLDPRGLARLLKPFSSAKPYSLKPDSVRLADGKTPKGYLAEWFTDAWRRYLPPVGIPVCSATSATSATGAES